MHHRFRRLCGVITAAVILAAAAGCSGSAGPSSDGGTSAAGSAAHFPVTVGDGGTSVTLSKPPTRIVSLSPTATEMLFAIQAGGQVRAVDDESDYPASAPRTKLDTYHLNTEAVAGYQPDLVVESGLADTQVKQLRALGIPVLAEPAATGLAQTYQQITQLGEVTGHPAQASALVARMKQRIAAIVRATPKPPAGTRYYYELDQTYYSVTTSTFIGQVFKLLGLTSIADSAEGAAAAGGYPQLSGEFVLHANPAYVFLADTKCCQQSAATVAHRPGWSTLAAVRDGRVVPLDDDIASRWGPRIVDLLQVVSAAMRAHPVSR